MAKRTKKNSRRKKGRSDLIRLVVKANELVEARYMFDVWETRFFQYLSTMIHKDDEDEKVYRVWFNDIKRTFSLKSNQSYSLLREAAKSIAGKSVYIGWMSDEFRRGRMHRVIKFVDFLEEGQSGLGIERQEYVDVAIDKDIRPFLLYIKKNYDPKTTRYTSYDIRNTAKLKPYGTRIYELLKQMEYKGFRTIAVDDLKGMFLITDEYPRFSNFYQKVIIKSIDDINKYSDITVPVEKIQNIKKGRKITALRFTIESKSPHELALIRGEVIEQSLFPFPAGEISEMEIDETTIDILFREYEEVVVKSFGVTPSAFLKILNVQQYTRDEIEQAISVTRRAKYNQQIKKSVSGFFLQALKDGFTDEKEEVIKAEKRKQENVQKNQLLQNKIIALLDERSKEINDRIRVITNEDHAVTEKAIEAIKNNLVTEAMIRTKERELNRPLELEDYRKDEKLRGMVISNIVQFEKEQFEDIFARYNSEIEALEKEIAGMAGKSLHQVAVPEQR